MAATSFTEVVADFMARRGITGRGLAGMIPYNPGGMSRILSGQRRCPPDVAARIDDLLGADGAIKRAAAAAPEPPPDAERIRRSLEDALSDGAAPPAVLDDWDATVARHGYRTRDTPSPLLLADLTADLADLRLAIGRHRSASALPRLAVTASQISGLVVLTLIKAGDRQAWRRWARTARHAASQGDDTAVLSWVIAQEAYGWYYARDMQEAIATARAAQDTGHRAGVGAALAAALEMRACAFTGDRAGASRAYAAAEQALAGLTGDQLAASAFGYSESQLRFHAGSAWVTLGDTTAAAEAATRAIELCAPGDYTDWALSRLDLAACHAIDGDADSAIAYAAETLRALDPPRRLGIISDRARDLLASLPAAARTLPAARDVGGLLEEPKEIVT